MLKKKKRNHWEPKVVTNPFLWTTGAQESSLRARSTLSSRLTHELHVLSEIAHQLLLPPFCGRPARQWIHPFMSLFNGTPLPLPDSPFIVQGKAGVGKLTGDNQHMALGKQLDALGVPPLPHSYQVSPKNQTRIRSCFSIFHVTL